MKHTLKSGEYVLLKAASVNDLVDQINTHKFDVEIVSIFWDDPDWVAVCKEPFVLETD